MQPVGTNQNTASSIMAHLARKHSPVISGAMSGTPQPRLNTAPGPTPPNQYAQSGAMLPNQPQNMPTGRPPPIGPQVNPPGPPTRYQGGLVQTANQIPQTVLQRPPPSHVQANPILTSPKSPRSRSKSPGAIPVTAPQQPNTNPMMAPGILGSNIVGNAASSAVAIGLPTEKCQPPSQIPLPEGEVRIEKVPNLHAQLLQQAQRNAQQQSIHPALPLPLQVQQQKGIEVPVAAPSPDNDTLPNPVGLQQQMQQAMEAAKAVSAQSVALPRATPLQQPTTVPVAASPQQPNHNTPPLPGTTQYVPIQPKPNVSVPSSSAPNNLQLQTPQQQTVQVGVPAQNQMQVLLINRPTQPGSVQQQPQQQQNAASMSQQQVQRQFVPQDTSLPNQFPRLGGHMPPSATATSNDSPLIKRLLQSGTGGPPPFQVSPPTRVSPTQQQIPSPQQQVVQPNPTAAMPNNSQWAGSNQPAPQVQQPTQGSNHAVPVQTTQPTMQSQNIVGYVNNTAIVPQANLPVHRPPPPPLPTVNEQLQQHREHQKQLQLQQQQVVANNGPASSSQPTANCNNSSNHIENHNADNIQKTNGPTNPPVLNQESTNGPKVSEQPLTENNEVVPKCNGTSQEHDESVSKSVASEDKMEVDSIVKPVSKPVDSLLKQHLVNGYASDSDVPIKNDVVVGRVEEEKSSGILEAALSIAGIEPDSDSRTSSGKSTPVDPLMFGGKGNEPLNHVLNGDILCDSKSKNMPLVADVNSNQGTKTGVVIIGNNGTVQDPNIPNQNVVTNATGKPLNQLILCRDIRENLPANLHILPSNYNNNNQQQQQTQAVVSGAVAPQVATNLNTASGSVQLVAQPGLKQVSTQQPVSSTAVSRANTVMQGAIITVQQPSGQAQLQMTRPQGQPVTFQLQQGQQPVGQTVNVQQPGGGVRQLVIANQQQVPVSVQQQTLIVRQMQPQQIATAAGTTAGQQTMNIQVQNQSGQAGQQVIRLPVSIQGGQQQILSVQRPLAQAGQQQTQQSMIIVNVNPNQNSASAMPAPSAANAKSNMKSPTPNLKRPAPADSPKSPKSSKDKLNNSVDGSSSSSSHHKEKKKKHSSKKKRRSSSSSSSSSSSHHCSKKKDKDKDKEKESEEPKTPPMVCMCEWKGCRR